MTSNEPKMNRATQGAWIFHHAHKLSEIFVGNGKFERLESAGKAGSLLSALAASEDTSLEEQQVGVIGKSLGLNTLLELPPLLQLLEQRHLIVRDGTRWQVLGITSSSALQHTTEIFNSLGPTVEEQASLTLAEEVSRAPISSIDMEREISDRFSLTKVDTAGFIETAKEIGFVDFERVGQGDSLLFNGHLFRREGVTKARAVLDSLSDLDERKVREVNELLAARGSIEESEALTLLGRELLSKLHSISMFDINTVSNPKEDIRYLTRPAAFSKFGDPFIEDALDYAKALVVSLKYGMTRSGYGRGRIVQLPALMRNLINGQWVGPATAIGEDYRHLEFRRVLEIRPEENRFSMRLLKSEVGELALDVLTKGDASERALTKHASAAAVRYLSPERNRVIARKKQTAVDRKEMAKLLNELRTGN